MKFGYARVSTDDQRADMQKAALEKAGCARAKIFTDDGISGAAHGGLHLPQHIIGKRLPGCGRGNVLLLHHVLGGFNGLLDELAEIELRRDGILD